MKTLFHFGIALSVMALLPLLAVAGNCGGYASYLPSYNYGYNYYYPSYKTVYYAEVVPTPVALFQFVQPAVTTTVTQTTTQQTQQAAVLTQAAVGVGVAATGTTAAQTSLISDAQIKLLAVELAKALKLPDAPPQQEAPKSDKAQPQKPDQMPAASDQAKLVTAYQVAAICANRCMSCHTEGGEKGKVVLFNKTGQFAPNTTPQKMWEEVKVDRMPDRLPKLTQDEKKSFERFALNQ